MIATKEKQNGHNMWNVPYFNALLKEEAIICLANLLIRDWHKILFRNTASFAICVATVICTIIEEDRLDVLQKTWYWADNLNGATTLLLLRVLCHLED